MLNEKGYVVGREREPYSAVIPKVSQYVTTFISTKPAMNPTFIAF